MNNEMLNYLANLENSSSGGGGGAGMKLTKVTIINNRTETNLRQALSIYGVCDENGFAKQDTLRGGGRSKEVYVPNGNPETQQRWPKPCTMIFYTASNIPMNISSDIEVSALDYSADGKQQYILFFFADGNPITITVNNG